MATALDLLNQIRTAAGTEYTTRVPLATRNNITAVGNAIVDYEPTKNMFLDTLVNKIALTIVNDKMAKNKLAFLKKGVMPLGDTIEDIFVEGASSEDFNGGVTNPFEVKKPTIHVEYHKIDRKLTYRVTVSDDQLRGAFKSEETLGNFINAVVNSIYSGLNYDEYTMTKELIGSYDVSSVSGATVDVTAITDEATAKGFLLDVKKAISDISYMNTINKAGVPTYTESSDVVLLINKDVKNALDMTLAGVYNLGKVDIDAQVVEVDNFGTSGADVYAILVDRNSVMIKEQLRTVESQRNARSLYTNYFLHYFALYSIRTTGNVIVFKKKAS